MSKMRTFAGNKPLTTKSRHYVNDWGVTVYAYQTELGGVYHSEQAAMSVALDGAIHSLVRFLDVANDVKDGRKMNDVRQAIGEYYVALATGKDARASRDVAFLTIEETLGMTPNVKT
jgi:hypothetical protein